MPHIDLQVSPLFYLCTPVQFLWSVSFHPQVSFKLEASRDSTWPSLSSCICQALQHDAILMNSPVQNFVRQLTPSHFSPFSALKNTTYPKQTSPKQSLLQLCSPHSLSIAKTLISQLYRSVSRYYIYFFSFQTRIHWSDHVWYFGGSDVHRMYSRVLKACRPTKNLGNPRRLIIEWLYDSHFGLPTGNFYLLCFRFLTPKAGPSADPDCSSSEHAESGYLSLCLP